MTATREVDGARYRLGVGLMLVNSAGRIFVGERDDTPGAWQMPQGGIDDGEDPREAALRELGEEIGTSAATIVAESADWLRYDFPDFLAGKAFKGKYAGQMQKWYLLRFDGQDSDIRLDAHEQEFVQWRWATPDEALAAIVPFKRGLYEAILAEFAPHLQRIAGV